MGVKKQTRLLFILSIVLGVAVLGSCIYLFFLFFAIVPPLIVGLPYSVQLLANAVLIVPLICICAYLLCKISAINSSDELPVRGIRQWSVVYIFVLSQGLYFAFVAFLLETLAPSIPLYWRGVGIPSTTLMLIVLILTQTRIRPRFELFLKRLFYGTEQDESR